MTFNERIKDLDFPNSIACLQIAFEHGVIDSLTMARLVGFLEETMEHQPKKQKKSLSLTKPQDKA